MNPMATPSVGGVPTIALPPRSDQGFPFIPLPGEQRGLYVARNATGGSDDQERDQGHFESDGRLSDRSRTDRVLRSGEVPVEDGERRTGDPLHHSRPRR